MKWRELIIIGFLLVFGFTQIGCAGINKRLKSFLGAKPAPTAEANKAPASNLTKFSDTADIPPRVRRQYKRTTKETLAEEASLESSSGSLWVMEGQGAYLFSQNIVRLVGDPLAVTLEGDPKDQLASKVNVIKKLIAKIEERQRAKLRAPSSEDGDAKEKKKSEKEEAPAGQQSPAQLAQQKPEEPAGDIGVKTVPTRIIERTVEGNYRVKGSQPFMIGNREYKVIVTGIVRAEDFNEEGISASKLLDSKFDIVSARRKEGEM